MAKLFQYDKSQNQQHLVSLPSCIDITGITPEVKTRSESILSKTKKPKGGWRSLKGLRYSEVQKVLMVIKQAAEAGVPFNFFVSIKPHDKNFPTDAKCKRFLAMKAKNLIQAVRGYGKVSRQTSVPAITIYEKEADGSLHCHLLIHVQRGNDAIQRVSDGVEVHSKNAHAKSAHYILKTRLPVGDPEAEASFVRATGLVRKGRQAAIRGVRMSLNKAAKLLLAPKSQELVISAADTPQLINSSQLQGGFPTWVINIGLSTK